MVYKLDLKKAVKKKKRKPLDGKFRWKNVAVVFICKPK